MEKSILFVDQYSSLGGGQRVLLEVIRGSAQSFRKIGLLIPRGGDVEIMALQQFPGINLHYLPGTSLTSGRKTIIDLFRLVYYTFMVYVKFPIIRKYDVIYTNGSRYFPGIASLSPFLKKKYIYHIHLDYGYVGRWFLKILIGLRNTAKLVVNSHFVFRRLAKLAHGFEMPGKVCVVENALSSEYNNLPFVDKFKNMQVLNVGVVGRIEPNKGQDLVVELAHVFQDLVFYFIGAPDFADPNFFEKLKEKAPPNVVFTGKKQDLARYSFELPLHVSLVPSKWEESFGLVAIESMASSCITIVSGRGGLKDIFDATHCFNYEGSVAKLVDILKRLRSLSRSDLARIAHQQFLQVQRHYALERFENNIRLVLGEALS